MRRNDVLPAPGLKTWAKALAFATVAYTSTSAQDPPFVPAPTPFPVMGPDGRCDIEPVANMDSTIWLPRGNEIDESMSGRLFLLNITWEYSGSPGSSSLPRNICVDLDTTARPVSRWPGICINWGNPANITPDWQIATPQNVIMPPAFMNDRWAITNAERTRAMSLYPVAPGEIIQLWIASFDGGAEGYVVAFASGVASDDQQVPLDTDRDHLPDAWERGKRFVYEDGLGQRFAREYDINEPRSQGGTTGPIDGQHDYDGAVGYILNTGTGVMTAEPEVTGHDERGDGFSAFEEYRGMVVQGGHYRMDELPNDIGPNTSDFNEDSSAGSPSGRAHEDATLIRNVLVCDTDALITAYGGTGAARNGYVRSFGLFVHRIRQNEMTSEDPSPPAGQEIAGPKPVAGFVNRNGMWDQRAMWIDDETLDASAWSAVYGLAWGSQDDGGISFNSRPWQVDIDASLISHEANTTTVQGSGAAHSATSFLDYITGHEIGHKVGLTHPISKESCIHQAGESESGYTEAKYWSTVNGGVTYEVGFRVFEMLRKSPRASTEQFTVRSELARAIEQPPDTLNPIAGGSVADSQVSVSFHGSSHQAERALYNSTGNPCVMPLDFMAHTGYLMDLYHEHPTLQNNVPSEKRQLVVIRR